MYVRNCKAIHESNCNNFNELYFNDNNFNRFNTSPIRTSLLVSIVSLFQFFGIAELVFSYVFFVVFFLRLFHFPIGFITPSPCPDTTTVPGPGLFPRTGPRLPQHGSFGPKSKTIRDSNKLSMVNEKHYTNTGL